MPSDYLPDYREYVRHTIVPRLYNEWAAVLSISTVLTHQVWVPRGHYHVYPNLYVMLIGDPGSGKGTACAILQGVLQDAGYSRFAPDRTTKEKFLVDLEEGFDADTESFGFGNSSAGDSFFREEFKPNSEGEATSESCSDVFILAEELSDFFGTDNLDFIAMLTKLWSYTGVYRQRIKTGRSVRIPNPCVNMFAATTHDSFQLTFPSRLLGTGFLARFILIYGTVPSDSEVAFPKSPDAAGRSSLGKHLAEIKRTVVGQIGISSNARLVLEKILRYYKGPEDGRFKNYSTRRFVQLLKLSICFSASRKQTIISSGDVINANTLLYATESEMGKALGEFGKSRNSEVANKIMQVLYVAVSPVTIMSLWKLVSNDLSKMQELSEIMSNLQAADKIKAHSIVMPNGKLASGFLAHQPLRAQKGKASEEAKELVNSEYLDYLHGGGGVGS